MRKLVMALLFVAGLLGLALTAFTAVKSVMGDYKVHTMSYAEFVRTQDTLDEFSYIRLTDGRVDPNRKAVVYIKTGKDTQRPWSTLYRMTGDVDTFTALTKPPVLLSFTGEEEETLLPASTDGKPIDFIVYGYFSRGTDSEAYADAIRELGADPKKAVRISYGAEPVTPAQVVFRGTVSLLLVAGAVMIRRTKPPVVEG